MKIGLDEVSRYASQAGRDPDAIQTVIKASLYDRDIEAVAHKRRRFTGNAEEIAEDLVAYQAVGVSGVFFDMRASSTEQTFERMEWIAKDVMTKVE